jgi:hypothetical protein
MPCHADDYLQDKALSVAIMGVMYTVCKEKATYGWLFILFRLAADWLQLWLLMVNPQWMAIPSDKL